MNQNLWQVPLYSSPIVYRPMQEVDSALLEVTSGCSWRKCTFCDFARDPLRIFSLEEIRQKARLLADQPHRERLFLLGQNPFFLEFGVLKEIFAIVRQELPWTRQVSLYARAEDVNKKTFQQLQILHSLGLEELHIGVESGCEEILQQVQKGEDTQQMKRAFHVLDSVGISYAVTLILGLGGRNRSQQHALETAAFLTEIRPRHIWAMALRLFPGTPLQMQAETGAFVPLSWGELLEEERLLLENIQVTAPCVYTDSTILGKYTLMGRLPEGKKQLLQGLQWAADKLDV